MFKCNKNGSYRYLVEGIDRNQKGAWDWISWYEDFEFEFNDRESYFKFRAWWKDEYMRLSAEIKEMKMEVKNTCREQAKQWKESKDTHWGPVYDVYEEQAALIILQEKARRMMAGIEAAKKEAARQMEKQREAA